MASGSAAALGEPATEDLVLHGLRIKGRASVDGVAELMGLEVPAAEHALHGLAATEHARCVPARALWQITPEGRRRHDEHLAAIDVATLSGMRGPYGSFLDLNARFKQLCTDWQLRAGTVNDHRDRAYDTACIARLAAVHEAALPVIAALAAAVPRLDAYRQRLDGAWRAVGGGETDRFTGVMKHSFHDIWMELHQDLILLLRIDRAEEGSF